MYIHLSKHFPSGAIVRHIPVTVTVKVHVPVLPELSVAEHVTVFAPTLNLSPEAGLHDTEGVSPESSVADIVGNVTAPVVDPASNSAEMSPVQFSTGGVVSVKLHLR